MPSAEQLRSRLSKKLKELFQLDQPDLDFGFYRIMHAKAEQVQEFIEKDLLRIVEDAFGQAEETRREELKARIEREIQAARDYGVPDPEISPKVKQAQAEYNAVKDRSGSEADVYDHLYRFFERYYDAGDFISRRYYTRETPGKAAPFAIPYNGEEVKLHWANADQYYIKTAEYFTNFTFDLRQTQELSALRKQDQISIIAVQEDDFPLKVHFCIAEAAESEHGDVKVTEANKRFFIIREQKPVEVSEEGELVVNFEYRPDPKKSGKENTWREKRNTQAVETILGQLEVMIQQNDGHRETLSEYLRLLKIPAPTEKDKKRPILAKYINQYTTRNTMDYFIHKDLGGFLRRELDFYIKNEVMRLDDIEDADAPGVESYLAKIRVLRKIAGKLIDFLAQLEDFQKKLWLKKKFVTETNYCITLDRVPEKLYPDITANESQREEWVRLFAIDEIEGDLNSPAYSEPITEEFLKANDKLVLDTQFFDDTFKASLLASIEKFDNQCDGLLVHSENFQALNLLQARFLEQVKCVYIDPPYNTGGDGFAYKDSYQHASWLTMISERLLAAYPLFNDKGVIFSSIDAIERNHLESILNGIFGRTNRVEEIIWVQNTTKNQSPTYSTNHEYIEVYTKNISAVKADFAMFRESKPGFVEVMELTEKIKPPFPPIAEIETALRKLYSDHKAEIDEEEGDVLDEWKGITNYNRAEYRDKHGKYVDVVDAKRKNATIWIWTSSDGSMPQVKQDSQKTEFRDTKSPEYRFYNPIHPVTSKPCPTPKTGWRWPYEPHGKQTTCFKELEKDRRIAWGQDESNVPRVKRFLHEIETSVAKSVVNDYTNGEKEITNLFGKSRTFGGPKPTTLIRRFCQQASVEDEFVCDFFAGSGTTGDAVISLNREDKISRKLLLVEMGDHFDTVLKPRIAKVIYSRNWKNGKPTSRHTGLSYCYKYLRLESYEDTLNNLRFNENSARNKALTANKTLKEDYMLRYLLDVETKGSQSLLNINAFTDPATYTLEVKKPGSDEVVTRSVDLVETFHFLIGLRVTHIAVPQSFNADFKRAHDPELPEDQYTKLVVDGRVKQDTDGPWWFRKIEGWIPGNPTNPNNGQKEQVLIVWRKLTGDLEKDNLMLNEWFQKNRISTRDFEFDTIYVNGSNNLPNLKLDDENWKVRLIEEEFMKRMWDVESV
jgi:adenine-specific DNA-methyltransferase